MKVEVCEVCFYETGKLTLFVKEDGFKKGFENMTLKLCEKHKDFVKKFKDIEELKQWWFSITEDESD